MDWEKLAGYMIARVIQHGRRRAAEMREVAETVSGVGLAPLMAEATAERQDWVANLVEDMPELKAASDDQWRKRLDAIIAILGSANRRRASD